MIFEKSSGVSPEYEPLRAISITNYEKIARMSSKNIYKIQKCCEKHLSSTSVGARTPFFEIGGPGAPAELDVVLTSMIFSVSPVAISVFFPEFISVLHCVRVAKDHLRTCPRW